jgi:hypothetical protein
MSGTSPAAPTTGVAGSTSTIGNRRRPRRSRHPRGCVPSAGPEAPRSDPARSRGRRSAALRSCPLLRCVSGDLGYGPPAHAKLIGAGPVAGKVGAVRARGLDAGKSGRRRGGAGLCARRGSAREAGSSGRRPEARGIAQGLPTQLDQPPQRPLGSPVRSTPDIAAPGRGDRRRGRRHPCWLGLSAYAVALVLAGIQRRAPLASFPTNPCTVRIRRSGRH